ncbi:type II CAAX prenyl endopeptidase Rce1 family protein [Paraurantiacibacter namhicola]|uniref:CAAX amino terminal protease self-immunity n=1 Tax=Paraurantiacibacter namhicola TaxID=645517 RepID=A0A1C7D565_9SPHN|nr:CPBP family glutamic-type intramembrane protease [Paraurantiacibacter namhicola]ANU06502.1 CAAX amino terminal protease self- immunity [Paraurantiacibacter namhicola]
MDTTSPTLAGGPSAAQGITQTWRDFFSFLKSPQLPQENIGYRAVFGDAAPGETEPAPPTGAKGEAIRRTLHLFLLDIALMVPILLIFLAAEALGVEFPDNALEDLDFGPLIVFAIVIVAPLMEEASFRGWLSGRPAALLVSGLLMIGFLASSFPGALPEEQMTQATLVFVGVLVVAVILALTLLRGKQVPGWYQRGFVWFYALSVIAFALIHIGNYEQGDLPLVALLPLVLPQAVAGLVWGYSRVTFGLWSSITLHAMHNGLAVGLILAFT